MSWTAGDVSGSQTLTDDDHLYPGHINELRTSLAGSINGVFNVKDGYGAVGDGVADDTSAIQSALTAGAGKVVYFPAGNYYITSGLTVSADTTIIGYKARIFNTATHLTFFTIDSGCSFYGLEIEGATNVTADSSGRGIYLLGTYDAYKNNLKVVDCYFHDIGFYGIYNLYTEKIWVSKCRFEHIGYSAVMNISCNDIREDQCYVEDIGPGTGAGGLCYGMGHTKWETSDDLNLYPRTKRAFVTRCTFKDIDSTSSKALDTHAGDEIHFLNNTFYNCRVAMAAVYDDTSGWEPNHVHMEGNSCYDCDLGASITGLSDPKLSTGCVVANNSFEDCGIDGETTYGVIYFNKTSGLVVTGNILKNCYGYCGITINYYNYGFTVTGNTIIDQRDSTLDTYCIKVIGDYNQGAISGNSLVLFNAALDTKVSTYGFALTKTHNEIAYGVNHNNAATQFSGAYGATIWYGHLCENGRIYVNDATPESAITAGIGAICINTDGGAGTTLYVKESGANTNTGWVAK